MLLAIREKARGWIAWVVIILIGAAFALFGLSNYMAPSGEGRVSARVDGTDIPREQLDQEFSRLRVDVERSRGQSVSEEEELALRRQALDRIVSRQVVMEYVSDRGMRITDEDLAGVLRSFEEFQTDGRFDRRRYESFARQQGTTPAGLEQQLRQDVLLQSLIDGIGESVIVTDQEVDDIIALERQQREIRYLLVDANAFTDQVTVEDEEIEEYFDANREEFVSREEVRLDYVELDRYAVRDRVELSDVDIRSRFDQIRDRFESEETRTASHILIAVPEDADEESVDAARSRIEEARDRLDDGESFADVAADVSDDRGSARRGGSLGTVERGIYGDDFDDALFALDEGAVSEPVRTEFGFHLIQMEDIQGGDEEVTLDDVRDEIVAELEEERIGSLLFDEQTRLGDLAYDLPDDLDQVAEEMGLSVDSTDWFSRDGGDGLASEEDVLEAAFSRQVLEDGENSDVINLGDDRYVVIRVADHRPSEQLPLDEVRDRIEERLREEKAASEARELTDALLERARDGDSLSAIADEDDVGVELREPGLVGRVGTESPRLLEFAFGMARPEEDGVSLDATAIGPDQYAVVELIDVIDGDPESVDQEAREQLGQQLRRQAADGMINAFVRDLRARADVEILEERLQ